MDQGTEADRPQGIASVVVPEAAPDPASRQSSLCATPIPMPRPRPPPHLGVQSDSALCALSDPQIPAHPTPTPRCPERPRVLGC